MAKRILVTVQDDLDGSDGAESLRFGLDGRSYEIDLVWENRMKLEAALAPYLAAARNSTTGRRLAGSRATSGGTGLGTEDLRIIRTWASEQGIDVGARGRIASTTIDAYHAAH